MVSDLLLYAVHDWNSPVIKVAQVKLDELEFFEDGDELNSSGVLGIGGGSSGGGRDAVLDATSPEAFFLATGILAVTPSGPGGYGCVSI